MSVTTTATTFSPQTLLSTLGDYELHHSGDVGSPELRAPPPNPRPDLNDAQRTISNPPDWPTQHRAVPPYRPINTNLDFEQRPAGMNPVEQVFIAVLLHGTGAMASVSQFWAKTGGKVFADRMFRYDIGGEW